MKTCKEAVDLILRVLLDNSACFFIKLAVCIQKYLSQALKYPQFKFLWRNEKTLSFNYCQIPTILGLLAGMEYSSTSYT